MFRTLSNLEVSQASFDVIWFSTVALFIDSHPGSSNFHAADAFTMPFDREVAWCVSSAGIRPVAVGSSCGHNGLRTLVALLTFGNREFEDGDRLLGNVEFIHFFHSEHELCSEFEAAGFSVHHLNTCMGGAILVKGSM